MSKKKENESKSNSHAFYSLDNILKTESQYNVIIGERSNGKTYACLKYALERYIRHGEQFAIIRRWREDLMAKRCLAMFSALVDNGEIEKMTKGEWTGIYYYSGRWSLQRSDENGNPERDETPFAFGFSLTSMEHDKSTSYPNVNTIIFDEFLSRTSYIPEEFMLYMNTLSTIIRQRDDVKIFMLGNTVTKYCPYFAEMGLTHVKGMKQGAIDVYTYGASDLRVAVEFCKATAQGKMSDKYFAFDNPKLNMITQGVWELAIYPHCPMKYAPKDVMMKFYIKFDGEALECECVSKEGNTFIFIHRKSTPLQDNPTDLIYDLEYSHKPNYRRNIKRPITNAEKKIYALFNQDKVFYSTNEVGEIVYNYILACK